MYSNSAVLDIVLHSLTVAFLGACAAFGGLSRVFLLLGYRSEDTSNDWKASPPFECVILLLCFCIASRANGSPIFSRYAEERPLVINDIAVG